MQPFITDPRAQLAIQVFIALGAICSLVEPFVERFPKVHAVVSRLSGLGLDVRKAIAGGKVDP